MTLNFLESSSGGAGVRFWPLVAGIGDPGQGNGDKNGRITDPDPNVLQNAVPEGGFKLHYKVEPRSRRPSCWRLFANSINSARFFNKAGSTSCSGNVPRAIAPGTT